MIVTVKGKNERHDRQIEFQAMLHGLEVEDTAGGLEIVVHDPNKILHMISECGGTIIRKDKILPMKRQDRSL